MLRLTAKTNLSYIAALYLFIIGLLILPYKSYSQVISNSKQADFEIGLSGGISINRFSKSQPHTGYNMGTTGGISLNYKLSHNFNVQLEGNFLEQGGQTLFFKDNTQLGLPESIETKNVTNSSYHLNSLELPLSIQYTFDIKQGWKPSIYVGGSYAYTFHAQEHYQKTGDLLPEEGVIVTITDSRGATNQFNRSRLGFISGANLKLPISQTLKILIDFRYLHGLTPARENFSYMDKIGFGTDINTNSFITKAGLILSL